MQKKAFPTGDPLGSIYVLILHKRPYKHLLSYLLSQCSLTIISIFVTLSHVFSFILKEKNHMFCTLDFFYWRPRVKRSNNPQNGLKFGKMTCHSKTCREHTSVLIITLKLVRCRPKILFCGLKWF